MGPSQTSQEEPDTFVSCVYWHDSSDEIMLVTASRNYNYFVADISS
jgi:hypothetical protein